MAIQFAGETTTVKPPETRPPAPGRVEPESQPQSSVFKCFGDEQFQFPATSAAAAALLSQVAALFTNPVEEDIQAAQNAISLLQNLPEEQKLDPENQEHVEIIGTLAKRLGAKPIEVNNPDNPEETLTYSHGLTIDHLNQDENIAALKDTLAIMLSASEEKPVVKKFKDYTLYIHNPELGEHLKPEFTAKELKQLIDLLTAKSVFRLNLHPILGLAQTSELSTDEDFEMSARNWATDTAHVIDLMKATHSEEVPKALETLGRFYKENEAVIQKFIDNPIEKNKDNPDHPINILKRGDDAKLLGIPHIFIPEDNPEAKDGVALKPDSDFNRWRQESHGNTLKKLSLGIREGVLEDKAYGLKPGNVTQDVIDTIGNLTTYFEAADYPDLPSGGNWEETPFKQGLTYDTAVIVDALKTTKALMADLKTSDKSGAKELYNRLVSSKNGAILTDEQRMNALIKKGEARLKNTHNQEAPADPNNKLSSRKFDASQAFTVRIATFDDDPLKNAEKKLEVLKGIEDNLAGKNGINRYNQTTYYVGGEPVVGGDSYLGPNYDVSATKEGPISLGLGKLKEMFGSKDCSSSEMFKLREELCGGKKEETAQWFFDPVVSQAYGVIADELQQALDTKKITAFNAVDDARKKIKFARKKQIKYLNKGLARITGAKSDGTNHLKSNGHESPVWSVPEAYQSVSTLKPNPEEGGKKRNFVVGRNSPLAWAETELYKALLAAQVTLAPNDTTLNRDPLTKPHHLIRPADETQALPLITAIA
ncbi:MAG: hypothetical protein AAGI66_03905 [Cyanobacteria bacterium P01_H01_bin.74]